MFDVLKRIFPLSCCVVVLTACGGGGGNSSSRLVVDPNANDNVIVEPENSAPRAASDVSTVLEDGQVVRFDVLSNDTDADGDSLAVTSASITGDSGGQVVVNADDSTISFTPEVDYFGPVTIQYTISDGEVSSSSTLTITVSPVNDAPVAQDDSIEVQENSLDNSIAVLANDEDIDSAELTIIRAEATMGTVEIRDGQLIYTPLEGFSGEDSVTYIVSDGADGTADAVVSVNVKALPSFDFVLSWHNPQTRLNGEPVVEGDIEGYNVKARNVETESVLLEDLMVDDTIEFVENDLTTVEYGFESLPAGFYEFEVVVRDSAGQLSQPYRTAILRVGS